MHRTEADGATVDNKYTEGNAALAIPATVVDAPAMNSFQEELCLLVERYGLVLLEPETDTFTQVYQAIEIMHKRGGRPSPITMAIANNQAAAADVTAFPQFDKAIVRGIEFLFTVTRKTGSGQLLETGRAYITWNDTLAAWVVSRMSVHDGGGVEFVATLVSGTNYKLQYTSDNLAGSSYVSALTITDVKELRV